MVFYQILKNRGACPHQNGWLWFEVCLVLSSGHWRSDLAKVSDELEKTQIPLDSPPPPPGKQFSYLFCCPGVSLPLAACVCAPLVGISSLPLQQGPQSSVAPSTLIQCWCFLQLCCKKNLADAEAASGPHLLPHLLLLALGSWSSAPSLYTVCIALLLCLMSFMRHASHFFLSYINKNIFLKKIK